MEDADFGSSDLTVAIEPLRSAALALLSVDVLLGNWCR